MGFNLDTRIRHVTAVLGPTNTGKTHLAIERMLDHETGMIGLPLRLLAREVYDKIGNRIGFDKVALITGEEKIKPERARFWVSTVEAMPREIDVDFLAIDEVQLAADPERGHVFTDRLLHSRGRQETFLLGAQTIRDVIQDLIPGANFISRPRLSRLTYSGQKKITRLPTRSAVVAFSAAEVYSIAELIRRQRGGAAVVLGALSPRTRNAQVALYQSGDVDFLVATDAIGMGLNLDVDHVAFSSVRKFDGQNHRNLTPGELGQIAGRAGRHMNDGTFGVTGAAEPFESDLIERLETHNFEPIRVLQWRNSGLNFAALDALHESLRTLPNQPRLTRARAADDVETLEALCRDPEIVEMARTPAAVAKLWEICQVPDYRKISSTSHAEMVGTLYKFLMKDDGVIPEDWFAKQVAFADRTDGDIDTLAHRIAHIRTWTFVSNRRDWLKDPEHWQSRTREVEDALSDAMHERLTQRFVDKRTSALMKGMRDKEVLSAEIGEDGSVSVEDHYVGRLNGFRFAPETHSESLDGKATRYAAAQVLSRELSMRARRVVAAKTDAFKLSRNGMVLWKDEEIGRVEAGEDPLRPSVSLLCDEHLSGPDKEKVQARLERWVEEIIAERMKQLKDLAAAEDVSGLSRGIAFQLKENFGILKREDVAEEVKSLDQPSRAQLRKYGVRFGAFNIYLPMLLKPAAAELAATLWALKHGSAHGLSLEALPEPPRAGLTSVAAEPETPEAYYRAFGFHVCGPRAVRLDILERLADLIRPLVAWRAKEGDDRPPPKGATGDGGFTVTPEMMSILGCSPAELGNVLKALGFRVERKPAAKVAEADLAAGDGAVHATSAGEEGAGGTGTEAAAQESADAIAATVAEGAIPDVAEALTDGGIETVPAGGPAAATASEGSSGDGVADGAADQTSGEDADAARAGEAVTSATTWAASAEPVSATFASDADESVLGTANDAAAAVDDQPATGRSEVALADAEAEEEAFIEVWRPRRHRSEGDRAPRRGRGQGRGRGRAASGASAPQPADGQPAVAVSGPVAVDKAGDRAQVGEDQKVQRRHGRGRPQGDRGRPSGQRAEGDKGHGARPHRQGGNNKSGGPGRPRRPEVHSSSPRKGGGVDPDSPFAALIALKAQLERGDNDG
ncbi:MAG: helicase [Alphaproteobacteria bacterium]|nr:helicase [Alphaproteobacteria bacterium]